MLEVAGTVLAAQLAMRCGVSSNVVGGTHHAESRIGSKDKDKAKDVVARGGVEEEEEDVARTRRQ